MLAFDVVSSALGLVVFLASLHTLWRIRSDSKPFPLGLLAISCASIVNQTWFATTSRIAQTGVIAVVLAIGSIVMTSSRTARATIPDRQLLVVLLPLWLFFVDALNNQPDALVATFGRLLPAVVMICVLPLATRATLSRRHVALLLTAGLGFGSVLTAVSPTPWTSCTTFKCGEFGALFNGAFPSGNYLAAVAGLAVIAALTMEQDRLLRATSVALGAAVLVATDSRTSQLACVLGVVIYLAARRRGGRPISSVASTAAITGVLATGLWLTYTAGPTAFSNRGGIWRLGVEAVGGDWLLGRGISSWSTDVLARNYMHSQVLLLLYGGGVVAIALYGLLIARTISALTPDLVAVGTAMVGFILFRGLTEIAWNALAFDGSTYLLLPVVLIGGLSGPDPSRDRDVVVHRASRAVSPSRPRG